MRVAWETTTHVGPMILDVGSLVVMRGRQLLISDRILFYVEGAVLPLMILGGLTGFWKYLKAGKALRQRRNIMIINNG